MKQGLDYIGISVTYFCHDGDGNFIMAKRGAGARDENGRWDTGGGAIEFGDTIENTLIKEIKEEYCTDVLSYEFLGYRDVHREDDNGKSHWVALDFKVLVDKKTVANGEPHKFDEISWFKLNTLPSNLHSQLNTFFEKYQKKL